jgi:hypothetical protein
MAYEIADHVEQDRRDDAAQLAWHLRDWADQHEKLGRGTLCPAGPRLVPPSDAPSASGGSTTVPVKASLLRR